MKTISLDVHSEWSQMAVVTEDGEISLEMKVQTQGEELRRVVGGVPGPKRVVFEEGPMSALIKDALEGVADEIISCDPGHNALIARAEDSNDERDTRRLALLSRMGALHPVYVPAEPYRTLRSLVHYDYCLVQSITNVKNRIKGLYRRNGVRCKGTSAYRAAARQEMLERLPNAGLRWQMESLYRQLDTLHTERVGNRRILANQARKIDVIKRLPSIPGISIRTAWVLVAWIVDPLRFKSRNTLSSYAGLGLGQGWTNWKPTGRARASKRGQRELKRMLFMAARAALQGDNALTRRYEARRAAGWDDRKAIRDVARTLLFIVRAVWITGKEYQDGLVMVLTDADHTR